MLEERKNIKVKIKFQKKRKQIMQEQVINLTFACGALSDKRQKCNFTFYLASRFPVKQLATLP